MHRFSGNHECAFAKMMNRLRTFLPWINPGFDHLKNKEVVFGDHLTTNNLAFKIGITFFDKWRLDARGGGRRESELLELVDRSS